MLDNENGDRKRDKFVNVSILTIACILIVFACRSLSSSILPMIIAVFIYMIFYPLVQKLYRSGMNRGIAMMILMVLLVSLIGLFTFAVVYTLDKIVGILPQYLSDAARLYRRISNYMARHIENGNNINWFTGLDIKLTNYVQGLALSIVTVVKVITMILIYDFFLFLENDNLKVSVRRFSKDRKGQLIASLTIRQTSRYMVVKLIVSAITAILTFAVLKIAGLNGAFVWMILVFLLNFIPVLGSVVITAVIAFFALLQFGLASRWGVFFVVSSLCVLIQFIVGNIIDPKLTGKRLNISPILILLSLAIWGFVFGKAGLFVAVPMTCFIHNFYIYNLKEKDV